ncbi:hypothetical protein [Pseudoduganella buxea]|uniref:Uncharacterized protein n=1 Tax=Pseudoduganella buxea TaxID=1949069 RepID=A0A6I3T429_9BURK|nr:hypothetical protein [Pseudoduganella buxea]MTV55242.1 hypothetical protein [Pseudoduganella buxea]GGB94887.1 hypothetical protein GCM10011572_16060 [Pseudoduganella buxea]
MTAKQDHAMSLVGGRQGRTFHYDVARAQAPQEGIGTRLLRMIGLASLVPGSSAAVDRSSTQADAAGLHAREFSNEQEAQAYAASMIGHGHVATVEQNVYDYSWSVEVQRAAS